MTYSGPEFAANSAELLAAASNTVRNGLSATFRMHESLGERGTEEVQKNQFGETAMRADIEAEEVLMELVKSLGIHIKVRSEEHGEVNLNPDELPPKLIAVMDGLDGSGVYEKERGVGRYGTMFAFLDGSNPRYGDYLAAGIMEHSTGRLALAFKGKGLEVSNLKTGETSHPRTKDAENLEPGSTVFVDSVHVEKDEPLYQHNQYFAKNRETFVEPLTKAGFHPVRLGSSAASYVSISLGEAELACESTRKGNLEFAVGYPIIHEAGGVVVTLDGRDIGSNHYLDFGQREHIPVIIAANQKVAQQVLGLVV